MGSLVIVALPQEDDYVNKISSEKVPHMTLLFLGEDALKVKNLGKIIDFTNHAANVSLSHFGLDVDRRGVLGPDQADVLFFSKSKWSGYSTIRDFRSFLLKEPNIRTAYDSSEQFPEWIPHLTLGFPDNPAKPDERDYPGINYVNFDRIAVWFEDYKGVEIPLKRYNFDMDMAMSDISDITDPLKHFGIKGMRWGVRKESSTSSVTVRDRRKKLRTSGGKGVPAHPDALRAKRLGQIAKKSGTKALSNEELQTYAQRLQLEQNVKRLTDSEKNPGKKFVTGILSRSGSSLVSEGVNKGVKELGKRAIKFARK
jgi:hypothetical protein